jgi:hypothetical protein
MPTKRELRLQRRRGITAGRHGRTVAGSRATKGCGRAMRVGGR